MKVTVVYKKSRLERAESPPDPHTETDWAASHARQTHTLSSVRDTLNTRNIDHNLVYRADLEPLTDCDLVVVVGGDGTFIDASHFVQDLPMLGVNSDPVDSIGFFCAATAETFGAIFDGWTDLPRHKLNRIQAIVDGTPIAPLALNDVLIAHENPSATWRGRLTLSGKVERLKNSGILVSTAAGSTAWGYQEGGRILPLDSAQFQVILRSSRESRPRSTDRVMLDSLTRYGKLFVDGPYHMHDFGPASHAELQSGTPLTVLGDLPEKRRQFLARIPADERTP